MGINFLHREDVDIFWDDPINHVIIYQLMPQISHPSQEQGVHPRTEICHLEHMLLSRKGRRPRQQCRPLLGQQEDHQAKLEELLLNQPHCCDLVKYTKNSTKIKVFPWHPPLPMLVFFDANYHKINCSPIQAKCFMFSPGSYGKAADNIEVPIMAIRPPPTV